MAVMKAEKQKKQDWTGKEFNASEKAKILDKLITARVGLLLRHPFFGNLATRLKMVDASDWCHTLATDGRNFYFNYGFDDIAFANTFFNVKCLVDLLYTRAGMSLIIPLVLS